MSYGLRVTVPPVGDVVSLREIKSQINQSDTVTADDVLLMRLASRATDDIAQWTNRAILTQTIQMTLDWPVAAIWLPRNPVQSVSRIEYLDRSRVWQDFDRAKYCLVNDREPAVVELVDGEYWPSEMARQRARLRITYIAGYGDSGEDVPETLRGCILRLTETYYRVRGADEMPEGLMWAIEAHSVPDEFRRYDQGTYSIA